MQKGETEHALASLSAAVYEEIAEICGEYAELDFAQQAVVAGHNPSPIMFYFPEYTQSDIVAVCIAGEELCEVREAYVDETGSCIVDISGIPNGEYYFLFFSDEVQEREVLP